MAKKPKVVPTEEKPFHCNFCNRLFAREKSLITHSCVKKTRYLNRDKRDVTIGFNAFVIYYKKIMFRDRSFIDFINSTLHNDFVKFGKFIIENNVIDPEKYLNFLITENHKLMFWATNAVYMKYLRFYTLNENPIQALKRNLLVMEQWGNDTDTHWTLFFKEIDTDLALNWIKLGKISPWVLYLSITAEKLFERMNIDQVNSIINTNMTNPDVWRRKIMKHKDDAEFIRNSLKQFGV